MFVLLKISASGEDPAFTPKTRKDIIGGYHSHPATPQSTVPSPGAASINSIHEEYSDINSPSWPRTPASPVRIFFLASALSYLSTIEKKNFICGPNLLIV